jgi:hypothetical protein
VIQVPQAQETAPREGRVSADRIPTAMGRGTRLQGATSFLRSLTLLCAISFVALVASAPDVVTAAAPASATPFVFNFEGTPASPLPWNPKTWDVGVESRNTDTFQLLQGMQAQHGSDCSPYPATHFNNTYEGAVFICRNHLMTAIFAGGYGEIALTPDHMIDFSGGESTVSFDLSTLRTSYRDWVDIWITPFNDNLVFPLDFPVDLQGPPAHAIQIKMDHFQGTVFRAYRYDNFKSTQLRSNDSRSVEKLISASATTRTTFQLGISPTHLRFGAPKQGYNWVDVPLTALGFSRGIVQLVHHSYNPTKDCKDQGLPACLPNTWHWANFSISNAAPFTLLRGTPQVVHAGSPSLVTFASAAPKSSFLRFAAIGSIEISLDGGKTWQRAQRQAQKYNYAEHFSSYWTSIPEGTNSVSFRGTKWFAGPWWVRDVSIWSTATPAANQPSTTAPNAGGSHVTSPAKASAVQIILTAAVTPPVATGAVAIGAALLASVVFLSVARRRRRRLGIK